MISRLRGAAIGAIFVALMTALSASAATNPVPVANWYWTMAVSNKNPNTLVLGTSSGLYRSTNGGKTWTPAGLSTDNVTSVVQVGSTLLAAGVTTNPKGSPVVATKGIYAPSPGKGVFAESTNGGTAWQSVRPSGLPATGVQALTVDPSNDQTVYAVLTDGKVYRSTNGGGSFQFFSSKAGAHPWALAAGQNGAFVAGDMTTGNYLSTNAKSWQKTAFVDPDGGHMVMEYAVQPGDLQHLLMTSYGVLSSTDGGKTWTTSLKSKTMFGPVAFAPSSPSVAYAVGWDHSLWRTSNAGTSWAQVS
jgi:photosystem II stability/assembly factor-like uncharacterized protein